MLRHLLHLPAGCLPVLVMLPALAGAPQPAAVPKGFEPITLAETHLPGAIAQQAEPAPTQPQPQPQPAPSPWAGTLELYGFMPLRTTTTLTRQATVRDLPRLTGSRLPDRRPEGPGRRADGPLAPLAGRTFPTQIEIPELSTQSDVGLGTILEHLTDVFYLRGSVEYNRIGFQTDLSYVGLGGQSSRILDRSRRFLSELPRPQRTFKVQVASTQGIYDFALRYRFGERERAISTPGAVTVIPYAGVRVVDLGLETQSGFEGPLVQRSRSFSFGQPIAQPLVGVQGQVFLTPRLRLFARGDLGGFGTNGTVDMSGNAQAGVGYALGNSTQLDLSWRYLYLGRDNGDSPSTAYAIDQNGIEMGVKFFF